ncbi:MAG: FHA domain-containing protein [Gammaproteobacteria bacterium]|nr:FHA domain-containing protein [Gammaproteobacteria bacterium]MCP5136431.1 FHA domain-containing protein [Gammaproteobacteria bacterium]
MDKQPEIDFQSDATVFGFSGEAWSLRGVSGEYFGKTIPIERTFTIGRAPDCELMLASKQVSRHHANISRIGTILVIDDLQSANGTFLNNHRITDQMELHEGDQIAFSKGERFLLTVRRQDDDTDEEDDDSYAQVVNNAKPMVEKTAKPATPDENTDTLTWAVIGVAVVMLLGVIAWAVL